MFAVVLDDDDMMINMNDWIGGMPLHSFFFIESVVVCAYDSVGN